MLVVHGARSRRATWSRSRLLPLSLVLGLTALGSTACTNLANLGSGAKNLVRNPASRGGKDPKNRKKVVVAPRKPRPKCASGLVDPATGECASGSWDWASRSKYGTWYGNYGKGKDGDPCVKDVDRFKFDIELKPEIAPGGKPVSFCK